MTYLEIMPWIIGLFSVGLYLTIFCLGLALFRRHKLPGTLMMLSAFTLFVAHVVGISPMILSRYLGSNAIGLAYTIVHASTWALNTVAIGLLAWSVFADRKPQY